MTPAEHRAAALRLDQAKRTRQQIRMISLDYPDMTVADAYAVQRAWRDIELASGAEIVGHKVGLTSWAMQQAVGIEEPDSGYLTTDMVWVTGMQVYTQEFIGLRIEAELAFVLKTPLAGASLSIEDVLDATDFVQPCLEMLDTRIFRVDPETGTRRTVYDTIADNAANAGFAFGGRRIGPRECDLRWVGAIASKNGEVEETGLAAGVLGHPAEAIAWLAERLAEQGERLEPGKILLSGSFIRPIEVGRGDLIVADYGAFGQVSLNFV